MLLDKDHRGPLRAALGEASGGFAARSFPDAERAAVIDLQDRLSKDFDVSLNLSDMELLKLTLDFALRELRPEEFQTVTGYDFEFGMSTLAELKQVDLKTLNE
jgi:hypothetical protein